MLKMRDSREFVAAVLGVWSCVDDHSMTVSLRRRKERQVYWEAKGMRSETASSLHSRNGPDCQ